MLDNSEASLIDDLETNA